MQRDAMGCVVRHATVLVQYGMGQYGMVWCGGVGCGMVQDGMGWDGVRTKPRFFLQNKTPTTFHSPPPFVLPKYPLGEVWSGVGFFLARNGFFFGEPWVYFGQVFGIFLVSFGGGGW